MAFFTLLTLYSLFFALIAWHRFNLGLFFLFLLLPTYLIRFNLGPLPTTLLEIMIWITFAVWLIKYRSYIIYHVTCNIKQNPSLFVASLIFIIAATIYIFTSVDIRAAAGEWKAFYIEPFLIFIVLITTLSPENNKTIKQYNNKQIANTILFALVLSGLATSLLAIYQHFTGFMVPWAFWENGNTFRVTGWYGFPNAVGLFLAPIIPLAIYLVIQSFNVLKKMGKVESGKWKVCLILLASFLFPLSSFLSIYFAKSTGGLIGIAAGIGLLLLYYKKTRWPAIIIGFASLVSIVSLASLSGIRNELTLQDRSGQIRLAIYHETWELIKDRSIAGAGLASYAERVRPYHATVNGEGIEIFHHPHNIFLTMWVNLGLLGLISFVWIIIWYYYMSFVELKKQKLVISNKTITNYHLPITIFLLSAMTALVVTGLVDSPYIKNDLAILFWLFPALLIITGNNYVLENAKIKKIG